MLFNSIEFAIFLPLVFLAYWLLFRKNTRVQNAFLIVVSYLFYGWWDWRFLSLIVFSSAVDFLIGKALMKQESEPRRKALLLISVLVNLGFLGFFKYYNFFAESFVEAFSFLGYRISSSSLNIILPVGISFYTFQTLSYSIDVYRKKMQATTDPLAFFAFVSFFPQLVAGPIERATNLLPQFYGKRRFDYKQAVDGMRQILWGLFKKIVIADNAARFVNEIFGNYQEQNAITLLVGAILFSFQIYGDFSGYSDIAIGTSRLFGFHLKRNFAFPYFSRDIAEFWRRWHISLSTWFRDYVYIPLGGSRVKRSKAIRNIFIIFLVSGFWHGANWTFLIWGLINALLFIPLSLRNVNRKFTNTVAEGKIFPSIRELLQMLLTFSLTTLAWVFFRSESVGMAFSYLQNIFAGDWSSRILPELNFLPFALSLLIFVEWLQRNREHGLVMGFAKEKRPFRWLTYVVLILMIYLLGNFSSHYEFIYFQF